MSYHKSPLTDLRWDERKELIERSLNDARGRVKVVAKLLFVTPELLWRYIKRCGITNSGRNWKPPEEAAPPPKKRGKKA